MCAYFVGILFAFTVFAVQGPKAGNGASIGAVPDCNKKTTTWNCITLYPHTGCIGTVTMELSDPNVKAHAISVGTMAFCTNPKCQNNDGSVVGAFLYPPDCIER